MAAAVQVELWSGGGITGTRLSSGPVLLLAAREQYGRSARNALKASASRSRNVIARFAAPPYLVILGTSSPRALCHAFGRRR